MPANESAAAPDVAALLTAANPDAAMEVEDDIEVPDIPRSLSFADVNEFVHNPNQLFEHLQRLCLTLATALEKAAGPTADGDMCDRRLLALALKQRDEARADRDALVEPARYHLMSEWARDSYPAARAAIDLLEKEESNV